MMIFFWLRRVIAKVYGFGRGQERRGEEGAECWYVAIETDFEVGSAG